MTMSPAWSTVSTGLSSTEAARRLTADGPNVLPPPGRPSVVRRLLAELTHFFALMLWVAGVLALLAGLPELGVAIFAVVVLNALFAFAQQARADRAADLLVGLLPTRVTVVRDGTRRTVEARDVVVGDVLVLESGDRVPADAEVLTANTLLLDTSMLTGESAASRTGVGDVVYGGTFLLEGDGTAVVTATGHSTRLADIAELAGTRDRHLTPLTRELHSVVRTVAAIALGVGGLFLGISVLVGNPLQEGFVFALGVTVALVPEALLPTVTLSLAWGAEQMARRQILVRRLEAVETLGSTTFICTDKTGTLTRNEMEVVEAWTPAGTVTVSGTGYDPVAVLDFTSSGGRRDLATMALAATRCSTGFARREGDRWVPHGDPMEVALDVFARRLGLDTDQDRLAHPPRARFPFDPRLRRMCVVVEDTVLVKGAPESVLPLCDAPTAYDVVEAMTGRGRRVLAVAARRSTGAPPAGRADAEQGLRLLGLVALEDPPRDDVTDALDACRRAGIAVAMVTGDHPATATSIADRVGLRRPDAPVLVGSDLPESTKVLGALLDHDGVVVARVSPEDKLRIAAALHARGHVVAMTGDGVNDAPALREADIGVAMGRGGTDVAREAADLVLLDDAFASIVAGVEQGRATYVNMRRFLAYHLTDNVAELTPFLVWALSGGNFPLALGVMQILALDLGTDTLSAVALGAEPPGKHLLEGPPVKGRLMNHSVIRRAFGLFGPLVAALTMAAFLVSLLVSGWRPGEAFPTGPALAAASGAAFMTVVLAQTANAFASRSFSRRPDQLGWTTNRLLLPAVSVELVFSFVVLLVAPAALVLGHASPPLAGWLVAVSAAAAVLGVDAADKRRLARRTPEGAHRRAHR